MQIDAVQFSKWVGARLSEKGWTQKVLAEKMSTSQSHLSYLLSGRRALTADHCLSIAKELGASPMVALDAAGLIHFSDDPLMDEALRILGQLTPTERGVVVRMMRGLVDS